jgi:hypothetical protein
VNRKMNIVGLLFGAGFGFVLVAARLTEYATIHDALKLDDAYVYLLMGAAIGVSLPLLAILERRHVQTMYGGPLTLSRSRPQRHHVTGGVLFGAGWAIAGTCPAPALGMIASGALLGFVAVTGLFTGLLARDWHARRAPVDADGEENKAAVPSLAR